MKFNCHRPQDGTLGVGVEKELMLLKNKTKTREGKKRKQLFFTWVQTKRAIRNLQGKLQIENTFVNYGHAIVQASDKSVIRKRMQLSERSVCLDFAQTVNIVHSWSKE